MKNNFSKTINRLKTFNRRVLPLLGEVVVNFSKERFLHENWLGTKPESWQQRKKASLTRKRDGNEKRSTTAKRENRRSLLIDSGRLKRSIRPLKTSPNSITIGTDVPYAKTHNEGFKGTISQKVKQHSRTRNGRKETVKAHTRTVNMRVPKRQFMPTKLNESPQLVKRLQNTVIRELEKVLK